MKRERYAFILIADEKYWNRLRERNKASSGTHAIVRKSKVTQNRSETLVLRQKACHANSRNRRLHRTINRRKRRIVEKIRCRKLLRNVRRVLRFRTGQNDDDVCEVQELRGT